MHEGYAWLSVLSGRMRLILGGQDLVLGVGGAAEFDTLLPHWFGSNGEGAAEVLSLFRPTGGAPAPPRPALLEMITEP